MGSCVLLCDRHQDNGFRTECGCLDVDDQDCRGEGEDNASRWWAVAAAYTPIHRIARPITKGALNRLTIVVDTMTSTAVAACPP